MKKDILILAIESSCDETCCAIVKNGREVLSNVIYSQIDIHKAYGGVVPEIASRNHILKIDEVVDTAIKEANITLNDIDAIAVTYGAGLVGALLVGVSYAKALAFALNKPLVKVNHIAGHISANYVAHKELEPPYIGLIVSGGHTLIIEVKDYLNHELIGTTVDDAVGEAFDKVARVVGLSYPGGPNVDRLSKNGKNIIPLKIKFNESDGYNVSYSGLKTAVINYVHTLEQKGESVNKEDLCLSFTKSALDILITKSILACKEKGLNKLSIGGGVAANDYLRENLQKACDKENITLYLPPKKLCTDNAVMIGVRGYYNYINNVDIADNKLNAVPNLSF